jgi:predicted ATPase/class 3 adenylate cyclase
LNCPNCEQENREQAKFCDACGARLVAEATPTTRGRAPRDYTPRHLADKILQSKSALEGERKQVTVLFADVKGSMELAEQVDDEEWHRILDGFFQILTDGVHRFEGTINQYTGDGIMALFGAPIAHEDHARRACYAALHLRDELRRYADELRRSRGLNFSVRLGLHSGPVVVGKIGDDLRMDYTAQGQTVGVASRVEQLAEAGCVYLTQEVARAVGRYFELRDLGEFELKGVAVPLRVHALEGVGMFRTRLDVSRARGFSKFVGRVDEMAVLEEALRAATAGQGRVVGVVGDAGVGKSRLCMEFLRRCRGEGIPIYESHCPTHGGAVPFLPILELFRSYLGVSDQDGPLEARRKIAGTLLLLDESFRSQLSLLFDFLGISDPEHPAPPMEAEARQRRLFEFTERLIRVRSERGPSVTLVDDLHWIDPGSDSMLAELIGSVKETRSLLLVNFRPEYRADWMKKPYYRSLPLVPLGPAEIQELLGSVLGEDPSVSALPELIRERTGGNPFFIEEVVESLAEAGELAGTKGAYRLARPVKELAIPTTVQDVLAARIDRLAEGARRVLQTAAVIGKEFSGRLLTRVVELPERELDDALRLLLEAEFIYEEAVYPEAEYSFKHLQTQEVALNSQLSQRRRQVHAAVADAVEDLDADRLDEQAALLAHHWEAAGETLQAAHWHGRAAEWARASDTAAAAHHWERVRTLLRDMPQSAERDGLLLAACQRLLSMGWRLGVSEAEARRLFEEGWALAERAGDFQSRVMLVGVYGRVRCSAGDVREYLELARVAERLAQGNEDVHLEAYARVIMLDAHHNFGADFRQELALADQTLERFPPDPELTRHLLGFSAYGMFSFSRAKALCCSGQLAEARQELERMLKIARETGSAELECWAHWCQAEIAYLAGDAGAARAAARQASGSAEKLGTPTHLLGMVHAALALAQLVSGRAEQAADSARSLLALQRETGAALAQEPEALANLAEALLQAEQHDEALSSAEEAIDVSRRIPRRFFEIRGHLIRALCLMRSGGAGASSDVEAALAEAESLVEQTGALVLSPYLHEARAELSGVRGDESTQDHHLREAHRLYTEMGASGRAERLKGIREERHVEASSL